MALNIKSAETDRLARERAALTGESITEAVTKALASRLDEERRVKGREQQMARAAALDELFDRLACYPVNDPRPADLLLGYDADGTFGR